mgnify:CR=1 FL=1|tara:strand:+ start:437 stop:772 length:336 start_codon:yes stop_codon:yes gene_type:complete
MAIYRTNEIRIDLNELVSIRSSFLGEKLSEEDVENLGDELKYSLTFDTLYGMVDQAILEYLDKDENHYGEIQPEPGREAWLNEIEKNKKQFEMVDLEGGSWTIQVPRRKKK